MEGKEKGGLTDVRESWGGKLFGRGSGEAGQ